MTYTTLHLHLTPHPAPTPTGAIDYACEASKALEAKLSVSSSRLTIREPVNWLVAGMLERMTSELQAAVARETTALQSYLKTRAAASGIQATLVHVAEQWPVGQWDNSWRGRVADLCILGLSRSGTDPRLDIEDWLFGTGRPCLLYPDTSKQAFALENVLVCWDFSRSAARAVSDALPMLHNVKNIHVAVFSGDKKIPVVDPGEALVEFLGEHGILSASRTIEIGGRTIGQAILEEAAAIGANLIVMGAFGYSRMHEFLLGGATKEVLDSSTIPILLSH